LSFKIIAAHARHNSTGDKMTSSSNITSYGRRTTSYKGAKRRWRVIDRLRMVIAISGVSIALSTAPSHAACSLTPPNSLPSLKSFLVSGVNSLAEFSLDDENFTAPAPALKFSAIDTATGNFTGQIAFSPSRTYSISGKLTAAGGSNFAIAFSYRPSIGLVRPTDPTIQYTGTIRALVDQSCNVRYHIAGTYVVTNPLSVTSPKIGPVPFSGTGFTVFFG
jgi:hypothetical protein